METVGLNLTSRNNSYPLRNKSYSGVNLTSKPDQVSFGTDAAATAAETAPALEPQAQGFQEEPLILDAQPQQGKNKRGLVASLVLIAGLVGFGTWFFVKHRGNADKTMEVAKQESQEILEKLKEIPLFKEISEQIGTVKKKIETMLEQFKGNKEKNINELASEMQSKEKELTTAEENMENLLKDIKLDEKDENAAKKLKEEISKISDNVGNIEKFNTSVSEYLSKKEEITKKYLAQKTNIMEQYKENDTLSAEGQKCIQKLQEQYNKELNELAQNTELLPVDTIISKKTFWQRVKDVFSPKEQKVYKKLPDVPIP